MGIRAAAIRIKQASARKTRLSASAARHIKWIVIVNYGDSE